MAAPQQIPALLTQHASLSPSPSSSPSPPLQLSELRDPDDDWTGITEARDRRRRQNRLNQRAYRKRKARNGELADTTPEDLHTNGILILPTARQRAVAYAFMQLVQMQHSLNNHRPALLPSLIRLNAVNAVSSNALHIGIPLQGLCCDDVISPWNALGPKPADGALARPSCPESLHPTKLQIEIEHHPWVDLLPIPQLRDNMLRAYTSGVIDEDELCIDILGLLSSQGLQDAYLIVWGESHDASSWEVSVGFLKKWGWLLKGCSELVESTNRWRQQRGEAKIFIEV
ncbi:Ff.00g007610.m01.CDS01 [Fusarium sp. VM40]|nr:Ff.00g007610.m01.CDS01 [Fusarium sp. VM40]